MNVSDIPVFKDLVLVGGGHTHVTVLKRFAMAPIPGVRLTVISRDTQAPYSGMLPGYVAGHYSYAEAHIDLRPLAGFAKARFLHDAVIGIDTRGKHVTCENRPPVPYDVLSINTGSTPNVGDVPGASRFVVPVKPIDGFLRRWQHVRARLLRASHPMRIAIVGGGAGGVEIALAIQYRIQTELRARNDASDHLSFHLITSSEEILPTHNRRVSRKFLNVLTERGIYLHTGHRVIEVGAGKLRTAGGFVQNFDEIVWVTDARGPSWPEESGIAVDAHRFIKVNASLQSISHPDIFAAGDIANVIGHARPKSGVFAVRQGPPLAENLRRRLLMKRPKPFKPQRQFLSLISTGDKYAVASRGSAAVAGRWVWRWKDWIDRRFMQRFNELPDMPAIKPPRVDAALLNESTNKVLAESQMRCGGCGAKVGQSVLNRAISKLELTERQDIVIGLDMIDDAAVVRVPADSLMVHSVDSLRSFIDDPFIFGKICMNHALTDIYAMGAIPQTALALVTLPYGVEDKVESDLTQMLAGALEVLGEAEGALVGGHTSEGAELSLGFAVNGLVRRERLLSKQGMQAGDALIVNKPLGTGVLFAADMRQRARGRWIADALFNMSMSNRHAATCMQTHGATACTDVTGFGLIGHLFDMVKASRVETEIDLTVIPMMTGAIECADAGVRSSLFEQNLRQRHAIQNLQTASGHRKFPLVFDPQTAGGLLASVPDHNAEACVKELRRLGYHQACVIGRVTAENSDAHSIRLIAGEPVTNFSPSRREHIAG